MRDGTGRRVAAVLLACALLAGCGTAVRFPGVPPIPAAAPTAAPPVPRGCVFESCHGLAGDSAYLVDVPARWNGTLLLYLPGFVGVYPSHAGRRTPLSPPSRPPIDQALLDHGFAVASATYAWGGWSVRQGVAAAEAAYALFRDRVGTPQRVYVWGRSMGGLVGALLAERHPDWISGTATTCGVLGGTTGFFDLALDVAYGVGTLLSPRLQITGYRTHAQAARANATASQAVHRAAHGDRRSRALVLLIADLVHAAPADRVDTPAALQARLDAATQLIGSALVFSTYARWDLARSYGGEFSTNTGVDYAGRIDSAERAALERVEPGVVEQGLRALAAGHRVAADPAARARVTRQLDPTGAISRPMVTLHTAEDPVATVEHESAYAALVAGQGRSADLLQLVTVPPPDWVGSQPPPYGVGHCRFSGTDLVGLITVLDGWATSGQRPAAATVGEAFGPASGLDLGYAPPPWPGAR